VLADVCGHSRKLEPFRSTYLAARVLLEQDRCTYDARTSRFPPSFSCFRSRDCSRSRFGYARRNVQHHREASNCEETHARKEGKSTSGRSLGSIRNSPHGGRARSALRIFQENILNQESKDRRGSPLLSQ